MPCNTPFIDLNDVQENRLNRGACKIAPRWYNYAIRKPVATEKRCADGLCCAYRRSLGYRFNRQLTAMTV